MSDRYFKPFFFYNLYLLHIYKDILFVFTGVTALSYQSNFILLLMGETVLAHPVELFIFFSCVWNIPFIRD